MHWLIPDENDDDDEDSDGDNGSKCENYTDSGGVQTSQTPINKAINSSSSSVSGRRPSNNTCRFSSALSSSYGSTDHNSVDISRQQRKPDDAMRTMGHT